MDKGRFTEGSVKRPFSACDYSSLIAPTGQVAAQEPQETQSSVILYAILKFLQIDYSVYKFCTRLRYGNIIT